MNEPTELSNPPLVAENVRIIERPGVGPTLITIGSGRGCDVRVTNDPYAGVRHAQVIRAAPGVYTLGDLGTPYGTRIIRAGRPLLLHRGATTPLQPGDIIVIGRTRLPWTGAAR